MKYNFNPVSVHVFAMWRTWLGKYSTLLVAFCDRLCITVLYWSATKFTFFSYLTAQTLPHIHTGATKVRAEKFVKCAFDLKLKAQEI